MTPLACDASASFNLGHIAGCEWIVDASGCSGELLHSLESLQQVCERAVLELDLQVVGTPLWHQFPEPGGITGLYLLSESHLACHSWPEHGIVTFNLFCCRRRREWSWKARLGEMLLAECVSVRMIERGVVMSHATLERSAGGTT